MLTRIRRNYQDGSDFDALDFELKREQIFNKSEKQYIQPNYEIDSDRDWYGNLYRVWNGRVLLGTFYQKQNKWLANPFYKNRQYIKLEQSLERRFNSNEKAINYIIRSFEGK